MLPVKGGDATPGPQQGLLHQVFGIRGLGRDRQRHPQQHTHLRRHLFGERALALGTHIPRA